MSEQRQDSRFSVFQEMSAQQMGLTQLDATPAANTAHKSLAEWILARKRSIAATAFIGVAVTGVAGCGHQEASGHMNAASSHATLTPKATAPNAADLFPCKKGGSMGVTSTDAHVENYTGFTVTDGAKLFLTRPNDIEYCNGPDLSGVSNLVTSAEFEQISTGDRVIVYVTNPPTPNVSAATSFTVDSLAQYSTVGTGSYFNAGFSDNNGQREYTGATLTIPDEKNPIITQSYQGAIDRRLDSGDSTFYEFGVTILNNPTTGDNLAPRITAETVETMLGQLIDNNIIP